VVNQVSVRGEQGEIVGLLGPNGAGKTTTFYLITGLIGPDAGQVRLEQPTPIGGGRLVPVNATPPAHPASPPIERPFFRPERRNLGRPPSGPGGTPP